MLFLTERFLYVVFIFSQINLAYIFYHVGLSERGSIAMNDCQ